MAMTVNSIGTSRLGKLKNVCTCANTACILKNKTHKEPFLFVHFHFCLFHLLVQKIFLPSSNFFEHVQYFLNTVKFFDHGQKQDFTIWIYIFEHGQKYLTTLKKYLMWSKKFECSQFSFWTSRFIKQAFISSNVVRCWNQNIELSNQIRK